MATYPEIPTGYKPVRDILTGYGISNTDIGYDPATKNPLIQGQQLPATKYILGADQHYYADPLGVESQVRAMGLMPQQPQAAPTYQSPYEDDINNYTNQLKNVQPFKYDPSADTSLKTAQQQGMDTVAEYMNTRGILNSTVTANRAAQEAMNLIPQYEKIAYGRYQDENNRLMDFANFFVNLDDQNYQKFKDQWTMDMDERKLASDAQLQEYSKRQDSITNAYKMLGEVGYVTPQISVITGLPVGTLSAEARQYLQEQKDTLAEEQRKFEFWKKEQDYQTKKEKEIISYRESVTGGSGTAAKDVNKMGTPEQVNTYWQLRDIYFGGGGGTYAGKPYEAWQWLNTHRQDNVALIGDKLYSQLSGELEKAMGTVDKYAPEETPIKSTDYKTNPDFADDMQYVVSNPTTALRDIQAIAADLIKKYGTDGYNALLKRAQAQEDTAKKKAEE